uniref:BTB domain-containing protein n=1 Tax=Globisporangium ultimum (strain ATCC 200006 / CBS 805.95 / DAOM BR144) TaxID=431595 RepID=K3WC71_GLOUD
MALYVWGCNSSQQLGLDEDTKELFDVRKVDALNGQVIVDFSAGENHSLAVNEFGDVFAWGRGKEGQLGLGKRQDQLVRLPQRVTALDDQMIKKVSCGEMHSLALSVTGEVFMWGLLPETRKTRSDIFDHASVSLAGMQQEAMSPRALRENMTDNIMARLMRDSERVYESSLMEGMEVPQEVVQGNVQTVRHPCFVPRPCPSLSKVTIVNIAAGFAHSLASSSCGAVFSCGYNDNGQLGTGSRRNSAAFQKVKALEGYFIEHIACGQQHSLACSHLDAENEQRSGVCFSWGLGILGQLGSGINISWLPMSIEIAEPVVSIAAGSHHSVAVTTDGLVYTWGHSEYGQHGAGEMFYDLQRGSHYFSPRVQESLRSQNVRAKNVACSSHSTFVLAVDGNVYSWGWNAFGILGVGKYQHSVHPQKIFGLKDNTATHVGAGSNHGAAVVKPRGCHYSLRYDQVLKSSEFADIEFIVNNGKARERAHQVVVCARSGYLKGLLRVIMSSKVDVDTEDTAPDDDESKIFVVDEFKDVDGQVFRSFLLYLYTNRVEIPSHKRKALADFATRVCHDELAYECQDMWRKQRQENVDLSDEIRQFGNDMQHMMLCPTFADVEFLWPIQEESEQVPATETKKRYERLPGHKAVLSQVDYFRTMFTGGFSEGASYTNSSASSAGKLHEIELHYMHHDGVSLDAFKNLLLWIYTGSFELLKDLDPNDMMELYVGASLIGLNYLASLCERQLAEILPQLDPDSLSACLDFAERFDARRLKTLSQQILQKGDQVGASSDTDRA